MFVGHTLKNTCCGYTLVDMWILELFGGLYLYGCQRRTIMVDASLTKMLALASKERAIGFGDKTMLSMHTTYPLCGWIRSEASKRGAKPVGGCSISAGGAGVDLTFPDSRDSWESYSRWLHSPGATSCERTRPNPGKQDGAMAASSCSQ